MSQKEYEESLMVKQGNLLLDSILFEQYSNFAS